MYRGLPVRNMCDYSLFYALKGISFGTARCCWQNLRKDYLTGAEDLRKWIQKLECLQENKGLFKRLGWWMCVAGNDESECGVSSEVDVKTVLADLVG